MQQTDATTPDNPIRHYRPPSNTRYFSKSPSVCGEIQLGEAYAINTDFVTCEVCKQTDIFKETKRNGD